MQNHNNNGIRNIRTLLLIVALLLFSTTLYYITPIFTGFVIYDETSVIKTINQTITSDTTIVIETGKIDSLSINGTFIGNGTAKITLVKTGKDLVLWERAGQTHEHLEIDDPIINTSLQTSISYASTPSFDEDNDGWEKASTAIDYTVEKTDVSGFNQSTLCTRWAINGEFLECHGSQLCCMMTEQEPHSEEWNTTFFLRPK